MQASCSTPGYYKPVINVDDYSSNNLPAISTSATSYKSHSSMSKRRRIDRACDACRRRKTKCDGPTMPNNICSNCKQGHKTCTYVEESRPRGPPKAYITNLEDKVERMEALLKMLGPGIDLDAELGPPIIRDSWRTDHHVAASTASTSIKAKTGTKEPPSKLHVYPPPSIKVTTSALVPLELYPDLKDQSRSSSHSPSSSISAARSHAGPDHNRSPSTTSGSLDSWSDSDESDDDSAPLSIDAKRLTLGSMESKTNLSMESPLMFVGKSSSYGLSCRVRKLKAGYMDETTRAGVDLEIGGDDGDHVPKHTQPHRRMEFWTTPLWELSWGGRNTTSHLLPDLIAALPPTDLACKLIDLFFAYVNIQFPLLHRPTFERQWQEGLQFRDLWFSCLCLSVFAVSSRWCDDVRVLSGDDTNESAGDVSEQRNWRHAGQKYFQACLPIQEVRWNVVTPACLSEVQAHAAQSIFLRGTADDALAWHTVSIGLRKAQDRGAHRKKVYRNTLSVDEEQWKRAVWILIVFDRFGSTHLGRPCCVQEADFDLDLPVEVDDEYWENDDSTLAFQQPPGKPALISSFNCLIKLTQIMAFALRTMYAVDKSKLWIGVPRGPKWQEEVVMHLNTAMTEWVDSVPEHLRWSPGMPNDTFANQAATLYTIHYQNRILIYRPFIPYPTISNESAHPRVSPITYADFPFPAQTICIDAAKSGARIVEAQMQRGFSNIPNLISVSYVCAALLLTSIWDLKAKDRAHQSGQFEDIKPQFIHTIQDLLQDVDIFMKALEYAGLRWDNAQLSLLNLKPLLPGAVDESMPSRPMHMLDPVYPPPPIDLDWGTLLPHQDDNRQPTLSLADPNVPRWLSTSQVPVLPSVVYSQSDHRQSYLDATSQSHWLDRLYDASVADGRNSSYVPFASCPDDWSSQPPPRIRGYSTHPDVNVMGIRWSATRSPQIPGYGPHMYDRWQSSKGRLYVDGGIMRGIYTKT